MEAGSGAIELNTLGAFLKDMEFRFEPSYEHLKKAAGELGQAPGGSSTIHVKKEENLFQFVERCRNLEKLRVGERACFHREEVMNFWKAFEEFSLFGELSPEDLPALLDHLGIVSLNDEDQQKHLLDTMRSTGHYHAKDSLAFNECLHLVRRLFDEAEVRAVLLERSAQDLAELSSEDVEELRKVYEMFTEEEEDQDEFSYFALTKAVRLFGGALSIRQSTELENVFRKHAKPSTTTKDYGYLPFPEFLKVVHELSTSKEFPGLLTPTNAEPKPEETQQESNAGTPASFSSPTSIHGSRLHTSMLAFANKHQSPNRHRG